MIVLKNYNEINLMRQAGKVVADVLALLTENISPGVTTGHLNSLAEEQCRKLRVTPVFKDYPNSRGGKAFSGAICTSINDEVVHGIPGSRILESGSIISIDFGIIKDGYAGDAAITLAVGEVEPQVEKLLSCTHEALMCGIGQAIAGNRLGNISNAIQSHAEKHGFSVVRDFVGHGIGQKMHEDPPVPNYGQIGRGPVLQAGMTLAIEPMLNIGTYKVYTKLDEWTVATQDGQFSAHFEHTIAITESGPEILTLQ